MDGKPQKVDGEPIPCSECGVTIGVKRRDGEVVIFAKHFGHKHQSVLRGIDRSPPVVHK